MGETVRVEAPGKINLALRVGGRRPDGFHELSTVFCAVSLCDTVSATAAGAVSCTLRGPEAAGVGPASQNLAIKAAEALRRRYQVAAGVHLEIDKQIPVAGGMAGGSADAAGALVACSRLWGLDLATEELLDVAVGLGADVPFGLTGGCALGQGRGDQVTPVLSRGTYYWVLAMAHGRLRTPEVFRRFDDWQATLPADQRAPEVPESPVDVLQALSRGDLAGLAAALTNDLQRPAVDLLPGVATTLAAGHDCGALAALVCGSGPTVAFLTADQTGATDLAVALSSQAVARRLVIVTGPRRGTAVVEPA